MTIKAGARRLGGVILLIAAPAMAQTEAETEPGVGEANALDRDMVRLRGELDQLREDMEEAHQAEPAVADGIKLGGAVRFNYGYRDWNQADKDKLGTAAFDTFRINADGQINDVLLSAEFRWYRYQNVLHHAWAGYNVTDNLQAQLGVSRVPFGVLPYASHSFWFGLPYYVGLEDDYDSGLKFVYSRGNFSLDAAFYKGEEWGATSTERYSYDVVTDSTRFPNQTNEESNQFNLQARYKLDYDGGSTELGVSGQYGQLYNTATEENGDHWAAAAHANIFLGRWNLILEAGRYAYNPENPPGTPDDSVLMGAYADAFRVAAESDFVVANLAYGLPVDWGPVSKITFYENYSRLIKDDDLEDSELNVVGTMLGANPLYVYVDVITGKNMPYQGPQSADRLLFDGNQTDDDYHTRLNINVGYYF
ncbi:MAG: hypothetical protein V5A50_00335 [Thiohalorhabdus sp.]|uniref:hypothetical protein n=1 Tax=Thiohalorhabdus sp. TaxID=3094134 RepID=UPI002FC37DE4